MVFSFKQFSGAIAIIVLLSACHGNKQQIKQNIYGIWNITNYEFSKELILISKNFIFERTGNCYPPLRSDLEFSNIPGTWRWDKKEGLILTVTDTLFGGNWDTLSVQHSIDPASNTSYIKSFEMINRRNNLRISLRR